MWQQYWKDFQKMISSTVPSNGRSIEMYTRHPKVSPMEVAILTKTTDTFLQS